MDSGGRVSAFLLDQPGQALAVSGEDSRYKLILSLQYVVAAFPNSLFLECDDR